MSGPRLRIAALGCMLAAAPLHAQRGAREVAAEFFLGTAWNAPLPLTLRGDGGAPGLRLRARHSTRPLSDSPYYMYRLGLHDARGRGVEAELLHHKLYLENPAPPIEHLEITHGYNLPMLDGALPLDGDAGGLRVRVGIGLVVAHPEGRIAGRPVRAARRTLLGGGYHVAGGVLQLALGRRYPLGRGRVVLTAAPEVKLTAAFARMRIEQGTLTVPNLAAHVLGGLGAARRTR